MIARVLLPLLSLLALLPAAPIFAQEMDEEEMELPPPLVGRITGKTYHSPTGMYRIEIPVHAELGGDVQDSDNLVIFHDLLTTHITIACFPMDAEQRWKDETSGRKDYLVGFFRDYVQTDFQQTYPGAKIESARFNAGMHDGTLFTFNLLPGASSFEELYLVSDGDAPLPAKRGNMLFVKHEHVYIISTELVEKVTQRYSFKKTTEEEDELLRIRLLEIVSKMSFLPPKKTPGAAAKTPAPGAVKAPAGKAASPSGATKSGPTAVPPGKTK